MSIPITIATRESRLALWQAEHVKALLEQRGHPVTLLGMTTRGDQILDRSLSKVGGKGLFVKELETALEEGRADIAVHSLKDVPMELPAGFALACVMAREDPRAGRADLRAALAPLADAHAWLTTAAERAVSRAMGGSCSMPLAAHATLEAGQMHLRAAWGEPEGAPQLVRTDERATIRSPADAQALGERVAAALRAAGAH